MDTPALFSLEGRTALVTGGSRGIGLMIAKGFIGQGAKVYISSRKAEVCDAVAEELGPMCHSLPADISSVEGCRALADAMAAKEPQLDILVNNAGAAWGADFEAFPEKGWDKVMDLNVKSLFFLTQAIFPTLRAAATAERPAKVINIASIDGIRVPTDNDWARGPARWRLGGLQKSWVLGFRGVTLRGRGEKLKRLRQQASHG